MRGEGSLRTSHRGTPWQYGGTIFNRERGGGGGGVIQSSCCAQLLKREEGGHVADSKGKEYIYTGQEMPYGGFQKIDFRNLLEFMLKREYTCRR